ncbi:MAG: methyltransferase domain-containing protein [Alphaproteobacteria bacterium]|nr:methyltransferase domain-containing protein [Alphaproteobacteria bacterium]
MSEAQKDFVPALGQNWLTPLYDLTIALTTREGRWRKLLLKAADPQPDDTILDIGCGTASFAILLKRTSPQARIIGLDPDREVLVIAKRKANEAGADIEFVEAMGDAPPEAVRQAGVTKITSSLVLHQVPLDGKRAIIGKAYELLPSGGRLHIADFGEQRTKLMRFLFGSVQRLDGVEYTQPNADGVLPEIMSEYGFSPVEETNVIATLVGSISIYRAIKP